MGAGCLAMFGILAAHLAALVAALAAALSVTGFAPPTIVNAIEDALSPFGVRIYEQHLPPARILELIAAANPGQ